MRLRIFLILAVLFVLAGGPAVAGNRFIVYGGLNIANQGGDMDEIGEMLASELEVNPGGDWSATKGSITGLGAGVGILIPTSPTFGVQIEAQYIRRGSKFDLQGRDITNTGLPSSIDMEAKFKLDYLEIPFLFRFSPSPDAKFRPVVLAGPSVGLNVKASFEAEIGESSPSQDAGTGYADGSLGLIGGLGLDALVGETTHLFVQARYYLGLTNVLNDPGLEAKSSDLSFFIGVEVPLKSGSGDKEEGE